MWAIVSHFLSSNLEAVYTSIPAIFIILATHVAISSSPSSPLPFFQDPMVTACFICRAGSEATCGGLSYSRESGERQRYFRRHVLFHWPLEVLLDVFVCYPHDWKPGNHVPWLFTLTYFLATAAANQFFFDHRKEGTRKAAIWDAFMCVPRSVLVRAQR